MQKTSTLNFRFAIVDLVESGVEGLLFNVALRCVGADVTF